MSKCILVPSYVGHLEYVDKFLYSVKKMTPNNIDIFVIVGNQDHNEFFYLTSKYERVKLLVFSKLLNIIENLNTTDQELLRELNKSNYQSLKKYYGIYYLTSMLQYETVMIFDSETFCVRNVDINDIIDNYISEPFLLFSNTPYYGDQLKKDVIQTSNNINTVECMSWFLEYYLWIYERHIFQNFVQFILRTHSCSLFELSKRQKIIFIEVVYQTYIFNNNYLYNYKFIEYVDYIANNMPENLASCLMCLTQNAPNKPIEDARRYIDKDITIYAHLFYNDLQLNLYKTSDTLKSLEFIKSHNSIKLCVSEFSDIIYDNIYPEYKNNAMCNWAFVLRNIVGIHHNLLRVVKKTPLPEADHWVGIRINTCEPITLRIEFELFIVECEEIKKEHYIAIKKHKPFELYKIALNRNSVETWIKHECIVSITESDNCILIFDNAPQCEVLIQNLHFEKIENTNS